MPLMRICNSNIKSVVCEVIYIVHSFSLNCLYWMANTKLRVFVFVGHYTLFQEGVMVDNPLMEK